jgi:hypothetical protein
MLHRPSLLAAALAISTALGGHALAQSHAGSGGDQGGGAGATTSGSGSLNQGPSAGEMQRTNPPTTSNSPSSLSGGPQGSNTGGAVQNVPQSVGRDGKPGGEVSRSDSAR